MTNATGTTVWKADYEPFGKATVKVGTIENNLRFPGQYADRETGLHYNYFRSSYDPGTGRYGEADPIGLVGGLNVYEYAKSNPLTYTDPLGLAPELFCKMRCKSSVLCTDICQACVDTFCSLSPISPACCAIEKDECILSSDGEEKALKICIIKFEGCMFKGRGGKKPSGIPNDFPR